MIFEVGAVLGSNPAATGCSRATIAKIAKRLKRAGTATASFASAHRVKPSKLATDRAKRDLFARLSEHLKTLASEVDREIKKRRPVRFGDLTLRAASPNLRRKSPPSPRIASGGAA